MPRKPSKQAEPDKTPIALRAPLTFSERITQIGTTGLKRVGPYIREEYLQELQGAQGRAKYREMYNHDVVRRALRAIKLPMLAATWRVEGGKGPDAEKAREFLEACMDDMSHTWYEAMSEIITGTAVYGASWFQIIYKRRLGPQQKDGSKRSKHDDGLWGWRKWSPRGQETWDGWKFDEDGDVEALIQTDTRSGSGSHVEIPLDRSLHFTLEGQMNNPEGESLLRAAYQPFYGLKHADIWAGILIERMGGVPVFSVGERDITLFDGSDGMNELRAYLENAATAFRLDEQMGALVPWGIGFDLKTPPIKLEDVIAYIQLCSWRILGSVLAQFLELGQAPKGSFAKSQSDKDFFLMSLEAMLGHTIAETINRYEVPRLFGLNAGSFRLTEFPYFVASDIQAPDLSDIAEPLGKLAQAMLITPGPAMETWLRQVGKLPEEEEEGMEKRVVPDEDKHYTAMDFQP
ncbi:MAG TPA: hypothetical protein VNA25_30315 [Phycisphaerae bacterium]|nr:hypothetical protein [Phycisphaerae bacterium]